MAGKKVLRLSSRLGGTGKEKKRLEREESHLSLSMGWGERFLQAQEKGMRNEPGGGGGEGGMAANAGY
jgi:hypothetical protein